ncbi:MAG: hypothetical protein K0R84_1015 [Clostridia bacterium]|nr:hypothetical protein [Clostridia bacterium]
MNERILAMGDYLTLNDVRRVVEAAKEMNEGEELTLSISSQETDKVSNIFSVLENNNFELTTKGGHGGRNYFVIARKKHV